ncbi:MAG: class I SAM-dependent methyltransferase [Acidobacteria bacterium]|nr:class I SAM-dependent methyltransferase [Acidobacteriota bacterium]
MQLHKGLRKTVERILPGWLLRRIDPFQDEIDRLVARAAGETQTGMTVLDAGAGESRHAGCFPRAHYVALDRCIGDPGWDYRAVDVCGDLVRLPLAAGSVDRVLCIVTLEHVNDPAAALGECARVLKPGGRLYLVTPMMWEEHQVPHDYFRFTSWGLRHLLEGAGFEVELLRPAGGFFWEIGHRGVNLVAFFQSSWRWLLFPPAALLAGCLFPLICYYLDPLDREKRHTLGHTAIAVRR